jgi:hypothetical protein
MAWSEPGNFLVKRASPLIGKTELISMAEYKVLRAPKISVMQTAWQLLSTIQSHLHKKNRGYKSIRVINTNTQPSALRAC